MSRVFISEFSPHESKSDFHQEMGQIDPAKDNTQDVFPPKPKIKQIISQMNEKARLSQLLDILLKVLGNSIQWKQEQRLNWDKIVKRPLEITLELKMEFSKEAECSINITVSFSSIAKKQEDRTRLHS